MNHGKLVRVGRMEALAPQNHIVDIKVDGLSDEAMKVIEKLAVRVEFNRDSYMSVTLEREDQISRLSEIIMRSGANLREFTPRQQQLEETFMQVIEGSLS
jgi:ABC-type multidrug transport system ATPase subunit